MDENLPLCTPLCQNQNIFQKVIYLEERFRENYSTDLLKNTVELDELG